MRNYGVFRSTPPRSAALTILFPQTAICARCPVICRIRNRVFPVATAFLPRDCSVCRKRNFAGGQATSLRYLGPESGDIHAAGKNHGSCASGGARRRSSLAAARGTLRRQPALPLADRAESSRAPPDRPAGFAHGRSDDRERSL